MTTWSACSNAALRFKPDAEVLSQFAKGAASPAAKGATVWVSSGTAISPVAVRVGASDGSRTELIDPPFAEGTLVVTRAASAAAAAARPSTTPASGNPLMPTRPGGPRPPGL